MIHTTEELLKTISSLTHAISESTQQRKAEFEWCKSHEITVILKRLEEKVDKIMLTQEQEAALLQKLNDATNKLATNIGAIGTVTQTVSDEIDAFLVANPPGTVLTDAQVTALQANADKLQAASDASDAQVAALQAIATKGAGNPVPVPVPPPTTP